MKNITVSVDDEIYHRARIKAAEEKRSVSAVVREALVAYSVGETEFERLAREEEELTKRVRQRLMKIQYDDDSDTRNLTRDELHDRDLIRRHQCSDL